MDLDALRADARRKVSRQLTSAEYPDAELDVNINLWYQRVLGWIIPILSSWEAQGGVMVRDFKTATTDYDIPASLIRVYKAEVLYTTGGKYVTAERISVQRNQGEVEGNTTRESDDVTKPTIELFGNFVQIRPAPTADITNGIKLWAQIAFTDLADTTNETPNLLEPVQRVLSLGAAMDFAESEDMRGKVRDIKKEIFGDPAVKKDEGLKGEIEEIYSVRDGMERDQVGVKVGNWK